MERKTHFRHTRSKKSDDDYEVSEEYKAEDSRLIENGEYKIKVCWIWAE